jgi:hypothetical protein
VEESGRDGLNIVFHNHAHSQRITKLINVIPELENEPLLLKDEGLKKTLFNVTAHSQLSRRIKDMEWTDKSLNLNWKLPVSIFKSLHAL